VGAIGVEEGSTEAAGERSTGDPRARLTRLRTTRMDPKVSNSLYKMPCLFNEAMKSNLGKNPRLR
jgi:hypothetical protein